MQFKENNKEEKNWLILDGESISIWIENFNSVLDENEILTQNNGSHIKIEKNTNIIFETLDLKQFSPAIISRCGLISFEKTLKNLSLQFTTI